MEEIRFADAPKFARYRVEIENWRACLIVGERWSRAMSGLERVKKKKKRKSITRGEVTRGKKRGKKERKKREGKEDGKRQKKRRKRKKLGTPWQPPSRR